MSSEITVTVFHDIDQVPRADWDRLAEQSTPLYSYGWFKAHEGALGEPHYIAAFRDGRMVGLLPAFVVDRHPSLVFHDSSAAMTINTDQDLASYFVHRKEYVKLFFLNALRAILLPALFILRHALFPQLVSIAPEGYYSTILIEEHDSDNVLIVIFNKLNDIQNDVRARSVSFLWVREHDTHLCHALDKFHYHKMFSEYAYEYHRKSDDLNDDHNNLGWKYNKIRKRETNTFRSCYNIRKLSSDISPDTLGMVVKLREQHLSKYRVLVCEEDILKQFNVLINEMDCNLSTYIAEDIQGNAHGFVTLMKSKKCWVPKICGFIKDANKHYIYNNLAYYVLCEDLHDDHNAQYIDYGMGNIVSKKRRGCKHIGIFTYLRVSFWLGDAILRYYMKMIGCAKRYLYQTC